MLCITGNGLKTQEALSLPVPPSIEPKLAAFEERLRELHAND